MRPKPLRGAATWAGRADRRVRPRTFVHGSNCNPAIASGLAIYTYTAADSCNGKGCIQISANSTLDPNVCAPTPTNCTIAKVSPVASRISGTYAFQFSGYDKSNNPIAVVGIFTVAGGSISGVEEVLTNERPFRAKPDPDNGRFLYSHLVRYRTTQITRAH